MRITNEILTTGARLLLTPTNRTTAREHGFTLEPDRYFANPPGRSYLTQGRDCGFNGVSGLMRRV